MFLEAHSFPRVKLEENCEHRGTDDVREQISEHIFSKVNWGYCVYYPSNVFATKGKSHSDIPKFKLGHIQSRDAFRPVACGRKYLMDYKFQCSQPISGVISRYIT